MPPNGRLRAYSTRKPPASLQKTYLIKLNTEEQITILKKAVQSGLTIGDYIRLKALGDEIIDSKPPTKLRNLRSIPPHLD